MTASPPTVSRITLRPHDPSTGGEIEKDEVVRGYEYERGQYVTFTPEELKALDLESSKVIDLEMFIPTTARAGTREPNAAAARVKRQHLRNVGFQPVHRLSQPL